MNIVKGVADLVRRTSSGQTGESFSGSQAQRFSPPCLKIRFSDIGDEAILKTLWDRYVRADKEEEKRRLFFVFLKQFLVVYKNWEPESSSQWSEAAATSTQKVEHSSHSDNFIIGCFAGHPADIILTLAEEVKKVTSLVTKLNTITMQSKPDLSGSRTSPDIKTDGIPVLEALAVVTRSLHNCRVFLVLWWDSKAYGANERGCHPTKSNKWCSFCR